MTEYLSPRRNQDYLQVKRYPITSITSIHEDYAGNFDGAATSTDSYEITSRGDKGKIMARYRYFIWGPGVVKVVYTGGLARSVGAVPADLRMAAVRQVSFWYLRRASLGVSGESVGGGSVSLVASQDLLDDVKRVLGNYRTRGPFA